MRWRDGSKNNACCLASPSHVGTGILYLVISERPRARREARHVLQAKIWREATILLLNNIIALLRNYLISYSYLIHFTLRPTGTRLLLLLLLLSAAAKYYNLLTIRTCIHHGYGLSGHRRRSLRQILLRSIACREIIQQPHLPRDLESMG